MFVAVSHIFTQCNMKSSQAGQSYKPIFRQMFLAIFFGLTAFLSWSSFTRSTVTTQGDSVDTLTEQISTSVAVKSRFRFEPPVLNNEQSKRNELKDEDVVQKIDEVSVLEVPEDSDDELQRKLEELAEQAEEQEKQVPLLIVDTSNEISICDISRAKEYDGPLKISTTLATYPRSGNSWIRTLIEKGTGYLTSSVYCDTALEETFKSECSTTTKWLIKTHYPVPVSEKNTGETRNTWKRYDRVLHVVRNPFDSILSFHSFNSTKSHTEKANTVIPTDQLEWYVEQYRQHYLYWINVPTSRMLLKYEDLKADAVNELRRVSRFLLSPPLDPSDKLFTSNEETIKCAVQDEARFPYHSNTAKMDVMHCVREIEASQVQFIVDKTGDIMCALGYAEIYNYMIDNMESAETSRKYPKRLDCRRYSVGNQA